jgi:pyrimidine-nucleoside phosphorylase
MCRGVSAEEARALAESALSSGSALAKAREWIEAQGGDIDAPFPKAKTVREIRAEKDGYISHMDAETVGRAACELGAGRKTKEDKIDFSAGIVLRKKTGDFVCEGETLAVMHVGNEEKLGTAEGIFLSALEFSSEKPVEKKLIIDIVR